MSRLVLWNGTLVEADRSMQSRAFRYGDGLFETMLWHRGRIPMLHRHLHRLLGGMERLGMEIPDAYRTPEFWNQQACLVANVKETARLRLQVFRGGGGLYTPESDLPAYLLEAVEIDPVIEQPEGLRVDIAGQSAIAPGPLTAYKTLQCLPYVLAAREARLRKLDDVLLLNTDGRIVESSSSNVWVFANGALHTPPLAEGCIAGVQRAWLLEQTLPWPVKESVIDAELWASATAILLSNSIRGFRWIKNCGTKDFDDAPNEAINKVWHLSNFTI